MPFNHQKMSFGGCNESLSNVGGGFLSILLDMGDEKKCGSTLTVVPFGILFFLFSCCGFMLDIIGLHTAIVYSMVVFFCLAIILRMEKKLNSA